MTNAFPFLNGSRRTAKPRPRGITMVIDDGLGINQAQDLVAVGGPYIDLVKLGWGTSCFFPEELLREKIALYRDADCLVCPGGTLLEAAHDRGEIPAFFEAAARYGFNAIEVSNGIDTGIDAQVKRDLIKRSVDLGFRTLSEVGRKLPEEDRPLSSEDRIAEVQRDLEAGAFKVIMEARESGTVGIFAANGTVKSDLAYDLFLHLDPEDIIWEAPRKEQQVWLIRQLGEEVNIGNVAPGGLISLETLRHGLRGDTFRDHRRNATVVYLELGVNGALRARRRNDVVVMVDALRVSTTILQVLAQGARTVRPVVSADELDAGLSIGERGGRKLPNATFGNSPLELMQADLRDQDLLITSTNGTECIRASKSVDNPVLIGSITNCSAVAKAAESLARRQGRGLTLLAAGRNNKPAVEDSIGITEILKRLSAPITRGVLEPYFSENIERDFLSSDSGINIAGHGYAQDVIFCSALDRYDIVPSFDGEFIRLLEDGSP